MPRWYLEAADVPATMIVGAHRTDAEDEMVRIREYSPDFDEDRFAAHERFFVDDVGRRFVIGAAFTPDGDGRRLTLEVASPGRRWEPVGELTLLDRLAEDDRGRLAFDPWRVPEWMRPAGR